MQCERIIYTYIHLTEISSYNTKNLKKKNKKTVTVYHKCYNKKKNTVHTNTIIFICSS